MNDRFKQIEDLIPDESKGLIAEVIEEAVFLEEKLQKLKKMPFIEFNSKNKTQQRATPAAKMYKEFLQQYINCIKVIENVIYKDKRLEGEEAEESPLRAWFNANSK